MPDGVIGRPLAKPHPGGPAASAPATGRTDERGQAFAAHVEPEIEVLLRVAYTLTGSWADAEDLVQDTLLRAYRAIDRFDGAHPRAWLLTILRNAHRNSLRRRRPALAASLADLDGARPAFDARPARSPEDTVVDGVLDDDLQRAVDSLHPKFRRVLLLIDVEQLTYADVSNLLGVPVGTIVSRLSRARGRVRARLLDTREPRGGSR